MKTVRHKQTSRAHRQAATARKVPIAISCCRTSHAATPFHAAPNLAYAEHAAQACHPTKDPTSTAPKTTTPTQPLPSPVQQQLDAVCLPVSCCVVQGCVLVGVLDVHVGLGIDQQLRTLNLTIANCSTTHIKTHQSVTAVQLCAQTLFNRQTRPCNMSSRTSSTSA